MTFNLRFSYEKFKRSSKSATETRHQKEFTLCFWKFQIVLNINWVLNDLSRHCLRKKSLVLPLVTVHKMYYSTLNKHKNGFYALGFCSLEVAYSVAFFGKFDKWFLKSKMVELFWNEGAVKFKIHAVSHLFEESNRLKMH